MQDSGLFSTEYTFSTNCRTGVNLINADYSRHIKELAQKISADHVSFEV